MHINENEKTLNIKCIGDDNQVKELYLDSVQFTHLR